jgi:hypothetical protein
MSAKDRFALLAQCAHGFPAILALQSMRCIRKFVTQVSFEVIRESGS